MTSSTEAAREMKADLCDSLRSLSDFLSDRTGTEWMDNETLMGMFENLARTVYEDASALRGMHTWFGESATVREP